MSEDKLSSASEKPVSQGESVAGDMVFVVMGTTGEYSDRSEWAVRAFLTEPEARAWADGAKTRFLELCGGVDPGSVDYMKRNKLAAKNQYDPGHSWDYTGVDWFIYRVPLAPAVKPEPLDNPKLADENK